VHSHVGCFAWLHCLGANRCLVGHTQERAICKLRNSEHARELLFWSFPDHKDWPVVMPNRVPRILKAAFLCFRRFVKLDKHLRWRLTTVIVGLITDADLQFVVRIRAGFMKHGANMGAQLLRNHMF
jgi:hypothetical protein